MDWNYAVIENKKLCSKTSNKYFKIQGEINLNVRMTKMQEGKWLLQEQPGEEKGYRKPEAALYAVETLDGISK